MIDNIILYNLLEKYTINSSNNIELSHYTLYKSDRESCYIIFDTVTNMSMSASRGALTYHLFENGACSSWNNFQTFEKIKIDIYNELNKIFRKRKIDKILSNI